MRQVAAFGQRLLEMADDAQRLHALCRASLEPALCGREALVLRCDRTAETEPRVLSGPHGADGRSAEPPRVSRRLVQAACQTGACVLGHSASGGDHITITRIGDQDVHAAMVCPLHGDDRSVDLLYVRVNPRDACGQWLALIGMVAMEFRKAELTWQARREAEARARVDRDLEQARRIQRSLLPVDLVVPGLELATHCEPCYAVGGDYLDVVNTADGRALLVVADVCGKGLPAALIATSVHSIIHASVSFQPSLQEAVTVLNGYLHERLPAHLFVTMLAIELQPDNGRFQYVNAGHLPALIADADGAIRSLADSQDFPLGIAPEPFTICQDHLESGQTLLAYTDGLSELALAGGGLLGAAGVRDWFATALADTGDRPPAAIVETLTARITAEAGTEDVADDITLLVARRG